MLGLVVLFLGVAAAAVMLRSEESGPIPSRETLRRDGFAVWPQDTRDEAMAACDAAQGWQLDPKQTAERFARDVLGYPNPDASAIDPTANAVRYLLNASGVRGVFLGSVVDVRRYGRCWFIVHAENREDSVFETVGFVHRGERTDLVLGSIGPLPGTEAHVGYGTWDYGIEQPAGQTLVQLPELESDATGHIMFVSRNERGVATGIGANSLGFVPEPATGTTTQIEPEELVGNPELCTSEFRRPQAVIRDLYEWTLNEHLQVVKGYPTYERRRVRHLPGNRWRLIADDAKLEARVVKVGRRCWELGSLDPTGKPPVRSLFVDDSTITLDLHWGRADAASIALGSPSGADSWDLRRVEGAVTLFHSDADPHEEPFYVSVVLYKDSHVVSAGHSWYQTR